LSFFARPGIIIHQKPIVQTNNFNCELGDLLIVIKYILSPTVFEAKSIIYQVKLSTNKYSHKCTIDQNQLKLLSDWPDFSFGKISTGGQKTYSIKPKTVEFGSFMLELRNPTPQKYLPMKYRCYGICPDALLVNLLGPKTVKLNSINYAKGDVHNFFSHLTFEIGEHHSYPDVADLVEALYRYVGLKPDPPAEFDGYSEKSEDDGFAVIEINIKLEHPEKILWFMGQS
jgi:hypothetical protein